MVLLTATPTIIAAVAKCRSLNATSDSESALDLSDEPSLNDLKLGKPIAHEHLIEVSKALRSHYAKIEQNEVTPDTKSEGIAHRLDDLLRGSQLYYPPPPPKPEPTPQYKALMARLRAEEERRAYERLLNPPFPPESFSQRFPGSRNPFSMTRRGHNQEEQDEITYADVDRQLTLILNMLVSVIACGVAIWIMARYWDTPRRLFLSMGGAGLVGVAEVAIYMGYLRRMKLAKETEKKIVEKKEVLNTWVIEPKKKSASKGTGMEVLGRDVRDLKSRKSKKS